MFPSALLLLALDDRDDSIVEAFLSLAARLGVQRLTLVHFQGGDALPAAIARSLPERSDSIPVELERRAEQLRAALPDVPVQVRAPTGPPLDSLAVVQQDLDPDLLVLGRTAITDEDDGWGPVGRNAMRHCPTSALVVPQGWTGPAVGAVVGMDFSEHALGALKAALALFEDVVCLYQYDPHHHPAGSMTEEEFSLELARNANRSFEEDVLPELGGRTPKLEIVGTRRASDALVARADGDRLLVVGSRGLSRLAAMLLGSTAERIAGRAGTPVLIMREKGEVTGLLEGIIRR